MSRLDRRRYSRDLAGPHELVQKKNTYRPPFPASFPEAPRGALARDHARVAARLLRAAEHEVALLGHLPGYEVRILSLKYKKHCSCRRSAVLLHTHAGEQSEMKRVCQEMPGDNN